MPTKLVGNRTHSTEVPDDHAHDEEALDEVGEQSLRPVLPYCPSKMFEFLAIAADEVSPSTNTVDEFLAIAADEMSPSTNTVGEEP